MSQNNHIIEQNPDTGMMETIKDIFLVVQHQPESPEYDNTTIYTYSSREEAEECAKRLNLEYAKGVVLDEDGQILYVVDGEEESCHYYSVDASLLETEIDDEVYNPAQEKNDEKSDIYVIALYKDGEFVGFYGNPITQDKDKATYYNENTVENVAASIEDEEEYETEYFHYTKADNAK
ncbi:MAG: hypothetical protein IJ880_13910 [Bacilli bacterium]|nr:hypothetical protein [Bacilli bacterium]